MHKEERGWAVWRGVPLKVVDCVAVCHTCVCMGGRRGGQVRGPFSSTHRAPSIVGMEGLPLAKNNHQPLPPHTHLSMAEQMDDLPLPAGPYRAKQRY